MPCKWLNPQFPTWSRSAEPKVTRWVGGQLRRGSAGVSPPKSESPGRVLLGILFQSPLRVLPGPSPRGRVQHPQRCAGSWGNHAKDMSGQHVSKLKPGDLCPCSPGQPLPSRPVPNPSCGQTHTVCGTPAGRRCPAPLAGRSRVPVVGAAQSRSLSPERPSPPRTSCQAQHPTALCIPLPGRPNLRLHGCVQGQGRRGGPLGRLPAGRAGPALGSPWGWEVHPKGPPPSQGR